MAQVKREIQFQNSMSVSKRDENFAYLRRNLLSNFEKGIYPNKNFTRKNPQPSFASGLELLDISGSDATYGVGNSYKVKIIVNSPTDSEIQFYDLGGTSTSNTAIGSSQIFYASAFGVDGVYIAINNAGGSTGAVHRVNHLDTSTPKIGDADNSSSFRPDVGGFDGLHYWWVGRGGMWKQLPGGAPTRVFNTLGLDVSRIDFYREQMIIFAQDGADVVVLFWDKVDTTLFDKRIRLKNTRYLAGGVVDGRVMLVRSTGNTSNVKEFFGEIIISAYNGENFTKLNSIRAGNKDTGTSNVFYNNKTCDVGNEVMVFAVSNNYSTKSEQYRNFLYKLYNDGSIQVVDEPVYYGSFRNSALVVRVLHDTIVYGIEENAGVSPQQGFRIYQNGETNTSFNNYADYTQSIYMTNFLCNPQNLHRLTGFSVTFEPLFKNPDQPGFGSEKLFVYARTSERTNFITIGEFNAQDVIANVNKRIDQSTDSPIPSQRYQFTITFDKIALPEFNEIQFSFSLLNGMSVISAWFEYDYITRNVLK